MRAAMRAAKRERGRPASSVAAASRTGLRRSSRAASSSGSSSSERPWARALTNAARSSQASSANVAASSVASRRRVAATEAFEQRAALLARALGPDGVDVVARAAHERPARVALGQPAAQRDRPPRPRRRAARDRWRRGSSSAGTSSGGGRNPRSAASASHSPSSAGKTPSRRSRNRGAGSERPRVLLGRGHLHRRTHDRAGPPRDGPRGGRAQEAILDPARAQRLLEPGRRPVGDAGLDGPPIGADQRRGDELVPPAVTAPPRIDHRHGGAPARCRPARVSRGTPPRQHVTGRRECRLPQPLVVKVDVRVGRGHSATVRAPSPAARGDSAAPSQRPKTDTGRPPETASRRQRAAAEPPRGNAPSEVVTVQAPSSLPSGTASPSTTGHSSSQGFSATAAATERSAAPAPPVPNAPGAGCDRARVGQQRPQRRRARMERQRSLQRHARRRTWLERRARRREIQQQRGPAGLHAPQPRALHPQPLLLDHDPRQDDPAVTNPRACQDLFAADGEAQQRPDVVPQRTRGPRVRLAQQMQQPEPLQQPLRPVVRPARGDAAQRPQPGRRARRLGVDQARREGVPLVPGAQPPRPQPAAHGVAQPPLQVLDAGGHPRLALRCPPRRGLGIAGRLARSGPRSAHAPRVHPLAHPRRRRTGRHIPTRPQQQQRQRVLAGELPRRTRALERGTGEIDRRLVGPRAGSPAQPPDRPLVEPGLRPRPGLANLRAAVTDAASGASPSTVSADHDT